MSNKNQADYFQGLMQQILTLSAGGIAAGVAFMQINGIGHSVVVFIFIAITLFVVSLVFGIWGLMAIIGVAGDEKPDFDQGGVRIPNLISVGGFFLGIFVFLFAAYLHYSFKPSEKNLSTSVQPAVEITSDPSLIIAVQKLNKEQQLLLGYFIDRAFKQVTPSPNKK